MTEDEAKGRADERAAIVAFLRDIARVTMMARYGTSEKLRGRMRKRAFEDAAIRIENGDHIPRTGSSHRAVDQGGGGSEGSG